MKRSRIFALLISSAMALYLTGCGNAPSVEVSEGAELSLPESSYTAASPAEESPTPGVDNGNMPLTLEAIPEEYLEPSAQPGQVVRIDYESSTYDESARDMDKYAYVYLPYGYNEADDETRYNIFYLMHGWTGNAELYLGGENGDRPLKRILDHLIANGDMEPMSVVTPTYYHDNAQQGSSIANEDAVLTANFYQELLNDLMPAVESAYHTFADSADPSGLQSAREHRIFGGFSMGGVTTWYTFLHGLDYFKYYMPISGDCWVVSQTAMGSAETAEETARYLHDHVQNSGYTRDDFEIYALTGTDDTAYASLSGQIEAMKAYPDSFLYSDTAGSGNLHFQAAEGGVHNYNSMIQYIYNALPVFSKQTAASN